MPALIASSAVRTCLGDGEQTFAGLLAGRTGVGPLRHPVPASVNVTAGYHIAEPDPTEAFRASRWLTECVRTVVEESGVDPARHRVVALIGTGLRELAAVEWAAMGPMDLPPHRVAEVITISNACGASGHALALAQDLVELGDADAVIVAGADSMTTSMLTMIGRVADAPTELVRPFDSDRTGVLLGDGAAAVMVVPADWTGPALGRLVSTGLSCDAQHETAPDVGGIVRAILDACHRGGRRPAEIDLVVAHGTGTALNDPAECAALLATVVADGGRPLVTAVKGAVGHTSGAAALVNLDVAMRCLDQRVVPAVVGLRHVLEYGGGLTFVQGTPAPLVPQLVQVNAFGFGGVNAVTLVESR